MSTQLTYFIFIFSLFLGLPLLHAAPLTETPKQELIIQKDKIFDPNSLTMESLQFYENKFDFDWKNHKTIADNQRKIEEIEAFLNAHAEKDFKHLIPKDKLALGKLLYKLGTYYTHVARQPDLAIQKLQLAEKFLTKRNMRAWNANHLAYAFEQRFALSEEAVDKEKSLFYCNKVLSELYPKKESPETAFAFCIKGLIATDLQAYVEAENHFKKAIEIYEHHPTLKDDQYARTKNKLALAILEQNGRDAEAISILEDLKNYWRKYPANPYAARHLISLSHAYLKTGKTQEARELLLKAIKMYQSFYGEDSELLMQPYQLLADTYHSLGNQQLADAYQIKANTVDKSG